ncbi:predicted protein [Thalassiosira pseudonana CCMP1335]|uniref:Uncharacterized protein n=1 Tax=Thalassiosira pseudonana TaxID=35128 RepID=B5YP32_THAPS|nr:predicted protein [Thalassiosira pseudonana CCMP1335]ACI64386.1 predicted protein [Thalassiosira pseudonana CCMP1335]
MVATSPMTTTRTNPLLFEEASRLFRCRISSTTALSSPSSKQMKRCRYPTRLSTSSLSTTAAILLLSQLLPETNADFSGEWNGEWTAGSDDTLSSNYYDDDTSGGTYSMWRDDDQVDAMSPEKLITVTSIGIGVFMMLLCCVCYPEILAVCFRKCTGGVFERRSEAAGGEYVGGKQVKEKKKRRSKSRGSKGSSRGSKTEKEMELV